jgi:hypothetical protein
LPITSLFRVEKIANISKGVPLADFQPAFTFVMSHEDTGLTGKVTEDAGGRTRFGIAEKFHPGLPAGFFSGPAAEALEVAEQIYQRDYWKQLRLDELDNQNIANKILDMAVNMGTHQAAIYAPARREWLDRRARAAAARRWRFRSGHDRCLQLTEPNRFVSTALRMVSPPLSACRIN